MKKALIILLSALLLLSVTACSGKKDDDGTSSAPSTSQNGTSNKDDDTSNGGSQSGDNSAENNNQSTNSDGDQAGRPTTPVDPDPTDLTIYVPYGENSKDDNSQYFPPTLNDNGELSPGVKVQGTQFETPALFEAQKAITACKNEVDTVTLAKLQEYASKYADAYNKYYSDSIYKLKVSTSGNGLKYTYTVDSTRGVTVLDHYINKNLEENKAFYNAQVDKYQAALNGFGGIELCFVKTDGTAVTSLKFS